MFIGHYGIAFALKKYATKTSLGILFIAVQLVDIAFFILVSLGIEHMRKMRDLVIQRVTLEVRIPESERSSPSLI